MSPQSKPVRPPKLINHLFSCPAKGRSKKLVAVHELWFLASISLPSLCQSETELTLLIVYQHTILCKTRFSTMSGIKISSQNMLDTRNAFCIAFLNLNSGLSLFQKMLNGDILMCCQLVFFLWRKTALYRTYIFLFLNVQMIFCEMVLVKIVFTISLSISNKDKKLAIPGLFSGFIYL